MRQGKGLCLPVSIDAIRDYDFSNPIDLIYIGFVNNI